MKRKIIIASIIFILIVFSIVVMLGIYITEQKKIEVDESGRIEDIVYYETGDVNGGLCMITKGNYVEDSTLTMYSIYQSGMSHGVFKDGEQIAVLRYKYTSQYDNYPLNEYISKLDYGWIDVYNLGDGNLQYSINIQEYLQPYLKEKYQVDISNWLRNNKGELILKFSIYEKEKPISPILHAFFNIENKEILYVRREEISEWEDEHTAYGDRLTMAKKIMTVEFINYDEIGLINNNNLPTEILIFERGDFAQTEFAFQIPLEALPKENQQLYDEFPGLKYYQGGEGEFVEIVLKNYSSAEDILSLLMEEGQEISYEGCVLPAELSIDGQSHDIHSFEEYVQWRKQEE